MGWAGTMWPKECGGRGLQLNFLTKWQSIHSPNWLNTTTIIVSISFNAHKNEFTRIQQLWAPNICAAVLLDAQAHLFLFCVHILLENTYTRIKRDVQSHYNLSYFKISCYSTLTSVILYSEQQYTYTVVLT